MAHSKQLLPNNRTRAHGPFGLISKSSSIFVHCRSFHVLPGHHCPRFDVDNLTQTITPGGKSFSSKSFDFNKRASSRLRSFGDICSGIGFAVALIVVGESFDCSVTAALLRVAVNFGVFGGSIVVVVSSVVSSVSIVRRRAASAADSSLSSPSTSS
jgi:hypothetical protein